MGSPGTIRRLPTEIRAAIASLRDQGRTLDEILAKLGELGAAPGPEKECGEKEADEAMAIEGAAALIRRSRRIAEALAGEASAGDPGDGSEGRMARLNIELLHGLVHRQLVAPDGSPVELDAREVLYLGTTLLKLVEAVRKDLDITLKLRQEVARKAADAAEKEARARGLSAETVEAIRRQVLGVRT